MRTIGLVKVTVLAPHRRVDMALPEQSSLAEIVPGLLAYAGEELADDGVSEGGWLLRRSDGSPLELGRTLGSYRIRDGEVLHLVTRASDWPELEYDDLVDAIAAGAGKLGVPWSPRHTRTAGLTFGAITMILILLSIGRAGPPWPDASLAAVLVSFLLVCAGTAVSRALGDSVTGAVLGAVALPYAFVGGVLTPTSQQSLGELGPAQFLSGSTMLMLIGIIAYVGIADAPALFAGSATSGLIGVVGCWLALADSLGFTGAAVIVSGALLAFSPTFGSLAMRLGRVPLPILPRTTADLLRDDPQPSRRAVYASVTRAEGFLTALVTSSCLAISVSAVLLVRDGSRSAVWFVVILVLGLLLRARLYPVVRQRLPLQLGAAIGALALVVGPLMASMPGLPGIALTLLLIGAGIMTLGILTSTRTTNPYLGRYAELLEVVIVLAIVPVGCAVLGLYGVVRGLGG